RRAWRSSEAFEGFGCVAHRPNEAGCVGEGRSRGKTCARDRHGSLGTVGVGTLGTVGTCTGSVGGVGTAGIVGTATGGTGNATGGGGGSGSGFCFGVESRTAVGGPGPGAAGGVVPGGAAMGPTEPPPPDAGCARRRGRVAVFVWAFAFGPLVSATVAPASERRSRAAGRTACRSGFAA